MEGLEGEMNSVERDILNFSATFAIADVLLLHISQADMESATILESISYSFWHSSKISSKFGLDMPKIILLIRDPRYSKAHEETITFYSKLVRKFQKKVNECVKKMESDYIKRIKEVIEESENSNKDEKRMAKEAISNLDNKSSRVKFNISCYFCVYFREGFAGESSQYFQMKTSSIIMESNFEELRDKIKEYLQEKLTEISNANEFDHEKFFNIANHNTERIHNILSSFRSCSKEIIFKNILLEVKYNVFSHFRNSDGYLRFMEKFNKYLVKFEKLNAEISKKIKSSKPGDETDQKIYELKEKHAKCKNKIITEAFQSEFKEYVPLYLKYLSAMSYCDTFRLNQGIEDSFSYQALATFILISDAESADHQLAQIEKNINMYKCLDYYDQEFEEMIRTVLSSKFKLYETIYSIYTKKIYDLQKTKFKYKEDLDEKLGVPEDEMHLIDRILTLIRLLALNDIYPNNHLGIFLNDLTGLYTIIINQEKEKLPNRGPRIFVKVEKRSAKIYSFTLFERLIPSMVGILIGMTTTVIRSIIIAAAVDVICCCSGRSKFGLVADRWMGNIWSYCIREYCMDCLCGYQ